MSTFYDTRWCKNIVNSLMAKLYDAPIREYNRQVNDLGMENTSRHGKNPNSTYAVTIHKGVARAPELSYVLDIEDRTERANLYGMCLQSHPSLQKEYDKLADEFDELLEERYAVQRYLTNVTLFRGLPTDRWKVAIGSTLFRHIEDSVTSWNKNNPLIWTLNSEESFQDFLELNQDTIHAMNSRLLINLVTY